MKGAEEELWVAIGNLAPRFVMHETKNTERISRFISLIFRHHYAEIVCSTGEECCPQSWVVINDCVYIVLSRRGKQRVSSFHGKLKVNRTTRRVHCKYFVFVNLFSLKATVSTDSVITFIHCLRTRRMSSLGHVTGTLDVKSSET